MLFYLSVASAIIGVLVASGNAAGASSLSAKSMEERFNHFHGLARSAMASSKAPPALDDASYQALTTAPRDYAVVVLLTALDSRFGCQLCREFQPEWDVLARSLAKQDPKGESRIFFGTLDFLKGRETFISLGLQTAPVLLIFPSTHGPHALPPREPIRYDFTSGPSAAEQVHAWIAKHMPNREFPELRRPFQPLRFMLIATALLGVGTMVYTAWNYILPVFQNRNVWAVGTMGAIIFCISGQMFNHIRNVPYVANNGQGGVTYIAGGFQSQLGLETQIVALIYGILAFGTITLVTRVPRMTNPQAQLITVLVWVVIIFIANSFLMSMFRMKNTGYPFALPPFM